MSALRPLAIIPTTVAMSILATTPTATSFSASKRFTILNSPSPVTITPSPIISPYSSSTQQQQQQGSADDFQNSGGYIYVILIIALVIAVVYFSRVIIAKRREKQRVLKEQDYEGTMVSPPQYTYHEYDMQVLDSSNGSSGTRPPGTRTSSGSPSLTRPSALTTTTPLTTPETLLASHPSVAMVYSVQPPALALSRTTSPPVDPPAYEDLLNVHGAPKSITRQSSSISIVSDAALAERPAASETTSVGRGDRGSVSDSGSGASGSGNETLSASPSPNRRDSYRRNSGPYTQVQIE